jgi:benzoate-CoA ligase family protein
MSSDVPHELNIASWFIDGPAERHGSRIAILGTEKAVDYRCLAELTSRTGNALRSLGCKPADRVLIALPDSVAFVAAFFGAAKIGAIPVPVSPVLTAADYSYYLRDSGAKVAIVHSNALAEFRLARAEIAPTIIVVGEACDMAPAIGWDDIVSKADPSLEPVRTMGHDAAFCLYTSGSTGQQKAVVHRHANMVAASRNVGMGVFNIGPDDRTLSISRLFFAYGLCSGLYFPLSVGASTILHSERIQLDTIVQLISVYRPTMLFGLPSFFTTLLEASRTWLDIDLSSVRFIVSGGEPTPPQLCKGFRHKFGLEVLDGMGSTEMLTQFLCNRPGFARPGSCGQVVPNCEVRLVDDNEQDVAAGEIGILWVKGDTAFAEYWNKPGLTDRTKKGDWIVTNDRCYRDSAGFYYHCGRADEMVKMSGLWVSLRDIETALLEHPAVTDAKVIETVDSQGKKRLVGFFVGRDQLSPKVSELHSSVARKLPIHMIPSAFVRLSAIPLTSTGKVDRGALPTPRWSSTSRLHGVLHNPSRK